jgi:hypothetical protein
LVRSIASDWYCITVEENGRVDEQEINSKMMHCGCRQQQQSTSQPALLHFLKSGHFDSMVATMFSNYMAISDLFISCTYDE